MKLKLSNKQIHYALFGLILGDAYYNEKYNYIYVQHTNKQKFYVEWLEGICENFNLRYTTRYDYTLRTQFGEKLYSSIMIYPSNQQHFAKYNRVISEGRKIPSKYVLERINEFGLLLWFLDDGQLHVSFKGSSAKRFAYLNTQSFTYEENKKIKDFLKERFDIDVSLHKDNSGFKKHKDKTYYRIYLNATNFRKFYDIVEQYLEFIPKEFRYKFNMQYFPNRLKNSSEFAEKYNCNQLA